VHIDERAKREWKSALLVMNPEHLKQNEKVDEKTQLPQALSVAYYLKEDLRQLWNQRSMPAEEKFLEAWSRRADASGIRQKQTMAKPHRQHRRGLHH
jgi:transposase